MKATLKFVGRAGLVVALIALAVPAHAHADRDMCRRGAQHRGAAIDLDVKNADIHDVMRLLADVGNVNIVVPDDVQGKVTLKLKKVAWDLAACTIAAVHKLQLTANGNIVLVSRR
jgi:type IV pilus assembly protein PilQ